MCTPAFCCRPSCLRCLMQQCLTGLVGPKKQIISVDFLWALISGAHPGGHEKSSNFKAVSEAQKVIKIEPMSTKKQH